MTKQGMPFTPFHQTPVKKIMFLLVLSILFFTLFAFSPGKEEYPVFVTVTMANEATANTVNGVRTDGPESYAVLDGVGLDQVKAEAAESINKLVRIVSAIVMVIGGFFCLIGIVKYVIAHSEMNGAEQKQAILMVVTGIVLLALPAILSGVQWQSFVGSAY